MITITRRYRFEAAHRIPEHEKCGKPHGHSYTLQVEVSGPLRLDGMIIDFKRLDDMVRPIIAKYDHDYLNKYFDIPTVENVVRTIAYLLRDALERSELTLRKVVLKETKDSWATLYVEGGNDEV